MSKSKYHRMDVGDIFYYPSIANNEFYIGEFMVERFRVMGVRASGYNTDSLIYTYNNENNDKFIDSGIKMFRANVQNNFFLLNKKDVMGWLRSRREFFIGRAEDYIEMAAKWHEGDKTYARITVKPCLTFGSHTKPISIEFFRASDACTNSLGTIVKMHRFAKDNDTGIDNQHLWWYEKDIDAAIDNGNMCELKDTKTLRKIFNAKIKEVTDFLFS